MYNKLMSKQVSFSLPYRFIIISIIIADAIVTTEKMKETF